MIFKSLSLKNFQRYPDYEQTLDLSENGLRLIVADNGIGKSTLGYSIIWCLYGKTLQDSVDDVVNRYTKKNCKVSITFVQDGEVYKVIRYRKHETHENNIYVFKGDKDISMKKSTDTNQLILDIIKIPYQAFVNSTFFSTELYSDFMRAKQSERLSVFESLLSLKEVALFYDQAKKFHSGIVDQLEENNLLKAVKESEKTTIENSLKEYITKAKENILNLKAEKTNSLELLDQKKKSILEFSGIDTIQELKNLENGKRVSSLKDRKNKKTAELSALPESCDEQEKFIKEIENLKIDFKEEVVKETEIVRIRNIIEVKNTELSSLKKDEEALTKDYITKGIDSKRLSEESLVFNKELEDLKANVCTLCKQHVGEEFVSERKNIITDSIDKNTEAIWYIERQRDLVNRSVIEKKADIEKFTEEISEFKKTIPVLNSFIKGTVKDVSDKYELAKKAIEIYELNKKTAEDKNFLIKEELEIIEKEINDLNYIPKYTEEFILNIKDTVSKLENEIVELNNKLSEIDGKASAMYDKKYVEHQKSIVEKVEQVIANYILKENEFKEDDKYWIFLMECFSNKENSFKKFFIGEMIETFNDKVNQYLPFFFEEDVKITFDKELIEEIEMDGIKVSYSSFSSGQKARAEMSIAFSLFNLSRIFFSSETNLLIVDEILDANVDQRGIESALTIVEGLSAQTGIFVISHNQEMKDRIKNKIEIRRDENGFSLIK